MTDEKPSKQAIAGQQRDNQLCTEHVQRLVENHALLGITNMRQAFARDQVSIELKPLHQRIFM